MKLIIRQYLASLKERAELDAVLPDLLSELGFNVYSRPGRGTVQYGVDIAAIGEENGEKKVFLFSVKAGDLTRHDWHAVPQGLRASLDEIRDSYIPSRIPKRFAGLKIVICICFGGDVQEQIQDSLRGYTSKNSTDQISFDEWNGDKIAGLILTGVLREELLPRPLRSSFQKAVAMVDQPEATYGHFAELIRLQLEAAQSSKTRATAARQIYICVWILFVWARDVDNLEAPYRTSELALLSVWELLRPFIGKKHANAKALFTVLGQLIRLHVSIAAEMLEKVIAHADKQHAISLSVHSPTMVDVNLKLFDLLGRIAMTGLWVHWLAHRSSTEAEPGSREALTKWIASGIRLIHSNPALLLPLCDQQAIDICLFLLLAPVSDGSRREIVWWLREIVGRLEFTIMTHGKYPTVYADYQDLLEHPRAQTDEYRKEATSGSILIPLLAAYLTAFEEQEALAKLVRLKETVLQHCTMQLWLPDQDTENALYRGGHDHGVAVCDLPIAATGNELLDTIAHACREETSFTSLSAIGTNHWPIVLLASRHFRLPVPPQFWISTLQPEHTETVRTFTPP